MGRWVGEIRRGKVVGLDDDDDDDSDDNDANDDDNYAGVDEGNQRRIMMLTGTIKAINLMARFAISTDPLSPESSHTNTHSHLFPPVLLNRRRLSLFLCSNFECNQTSKTAKETLTELCKDNKSQGVCMRACVYIWMCVVFSKCKI